MSSFFRSSETPPPPPGPRVIYMAPEPEYLNQYESYNESTERGQAWLSQRYNFLMEILKFVPAADTASYEDPKANRMAVTIADLEQIFGIGKVPYNKIGATIRGSGPFIDFATDAENTIKTNLQGSERKQVLAILEEIKTKKNSPYLSEFGDYMGVINGANENTNFGALHSQGDRIQGTLEGAGYAANVTETSRGKQGFDFFDTASDFYHTNDSASKDLIFATGDDSHVRRGGSIDSNAIPIFSDKIIGPGGTQVNKFEYFKDQINSASDKAGKFDEFISKFMPTDYTNMFYGLNPELIDKDETATLDGLPNLADYSSKFGDAKNALNGIYTKRENGTVNNQPSFYQIAMDPTAPWNNARVTKDDFDFLFAAGKPLNTHNGKTAAEKAVMKNRIWDVLIASQVIDSNGEILGAKFDAENETGLTIFFDNVELGERAVNPVDTDHPALWRTVNRSLRQAIINFLYTKGKSGQSIDGTWWKNKQDAGTNMGQLAFNLAINLLEARRRYQFAMTEIFGPHMQFFDTPGVERGNFSHWYMTKGNTLDNRMIKWFNKWAGDYNEYYDTDKKGNWRGSESGYMDSMFLITFMRAQHRMTQFNSAFISGDAYYYTKKDEYRLKMFRDWFSTQIDAYITANSSVIQADISTNPATIPDGDIDRDAKAPIFNDDDDDDEKAKKTKEANDKWVALKRRIASLKDRLKTIGASITSQRLSSYRYQDLISKIDENWSSIDGISDAAAAENNKTEIKAFRDKLNGLREEIDKIQKGSALQSFKNEVFGIDDLSGAGASFSYQNKHDFGQLSWQDTGGNLISNIGIRDSGVLRPSIIPGEFIGKVLGSSNGQLGQLDGQHHYYSVQQQLNNLPYGGNWLGVSVKLNAIPVNDATATGGIRFRNGPYNWEDTDNVMDRIWMTHAVGSLNERFQLSMTADAIRAAILNDDAKRKRKLQQEEFDEELENYRNEQTDKGREEGRIRAAQIMRRSLDEAARRKRQKAGMEETKKPKKK